MKLRLLTIAMALIAFYGTQAATISSDSVFLAGIPEVTALSLATDAHVPAPDSPLPQRVPSDAERWWWNQLKQRRLNLADTTVRYPRFLGFCVKV